MPNSYFQFKQFIIHQDKCAMKVTTDACLFGAWVAEEIINQKLISKNCLDIGAGTGLLSLMLAQKIPDIVIDAIEIDKEAADQATENTALSPWRKRINNIHSDARKFAFAKKYDLIISNPPFYEKEIKADKSNKNIAHHSKELSLRDLLTVIKKNLATDGSFFLLLPFKRSTEIKKLIKDQRLHISKIIFLRQSVKHNYFRMMMQGKTDENPEEETNLDEISVWNENQKYTAEFTSLLQDYYLHI